jgi:CelD/BcsL family acetyltransferase involved in cellulose biosynthesis
MKVSVIRPGELGPSELARWRAFQAADPRLANPFLAPEFTLAVGRVRQAAWVAVLEDGPQVVGFFPYEVRAQVIGKAIGAGVSDCQGLVHAAGADDLDAMALIRACRLPVWEFDHLIADQRAFRPYHSTREGSPLIDLTGGYQAYLAGRLAATGGSIKAALRKHRRLARERGDVRFGYDLRDPDLLGTLLRWKSAQYRRTGMADRFATGWITQLVRELAASRAAGCTGTLCALYAGDQLIAVDFGLRSESVLVDWFPAYDQAAARYSPGVLLALQMAEAAAMSGIRHVDLGKGQAEFKSALKTCELPVAAGRVERSWPVAAARRAQLSVSGWLRG